MQQIIADNSLRLGGIVGIYPAASVGDDIHVYSSEERTDHVATFHGLRQQAEKDTPEAYMSLSDFIAPREAGVPDYLGLFANACFGLDKLVQPFKDAVRLLLPCASVHALRPFTVLGQCQLGRSGGNHRVCMGHDVRCQASSYRWHSSCQVVLLDGTCGRTTPGSPPHG